jgi:hypothetical protein
LVVVVVVVVVVVDDDSVLGLVREVKGFEASLMVVG